ncbi:MAG: SocA family protein [Microbacterium sp.]|nr:SocA family protein [Microbacterium sp.]
MTNVHDVAIYILRGQKMSAMKLQKLVYYSQAWSLTWDKKPLFEEQIEAWVHGPVVRDLYQDHRGKYIVEPTDFPTGDASQLDATQAETVDSVLSFYGDMSAAQLSELTHAELPWKQARSGLDTAEHGTFPITHESMQAYYTELSESKSGVQNIKDMNFPAWVQ